MPFKTKGSLLASFLFLLSLVTEASIPAPNNLANLAIQEKLHEHPTWSALLHAVDSMTAIDDNKFILSLDDFSLKNELLKTIQFLNSNEQAACRFPARRQFILSALGLSPEYIPKPQCEDYLLFKRKAPADNISLVYASENLSQPSSMMGHVMLKMSGENHDGISVEHGISYFTILNSYNVPLLIWDSLVTGKKGYFQISPYQEKLEFYLNKEQRNVWEYRLDFTDDQKQLFQNHIWELKTTNLKYFFNSYNCATVTKMLLRVGNAQKIKIDSSWLSPLDVVKSVNKAGVIDGINVNPSSKWKIRMLSSTVDKNTIYNVAGFVDGDLESLKLTDNTDIGRYLTAELTQAYNNFNIETGTYNNEKWQELTSKVNTFRESQKNAYQIDLTDFKSPIKTPNDSQVSFGYRHFLGGHWANFKYLPASHGLEDDNRQFFSENELKLMEISLLANESSGELKLDSWTLYSARSNIPWDLLTGGLSGQFTIGVEQHRNDQLDTALSGSIYGGVGYTYAVSKDLSAFFMLNAGLAASSIGGYVYSEPEIGLILYEVFNMKTFINYKKISNQQKTSYSQEQWSITHSILGLEDWSVYGEYEKRWNKLVSSEQYGLHVKYQY